MKGKKPKRISYDAKNLSFVDKITFIKPKLFKESVNIATINRSVRTN